MLGLIDFKTRKTRTRFLLSIIYVGLVFVLLENTSFASNFYYYLKLLTDVDFRISSYTVYDPSYGQEDKAMLYYILFSPFWFFLLLLPLYRIIKGWVSSGT